MKFLPKIEIKSKNSKIRRFWRFLIIISEGKKRQKSRLKPLEIRWLFFNPTTIEFSVKSGQHDTSTLNLVQNRVRFLKNLQKSILPSLQGEVKLSLCAKLSFIRFWSRLSFFLSASIAATYFFTAPTCITTIITSNLVH
jgi:hypothetical protein